VTLNFKPFIWCEERVAKGLYSEFIAELFLRVGKEYSVECFPWKRAMFELQQGHADGLFAAFRTHERETFSIYTRFPLRQSQYSVFTRLDEQGEAESVRDLFGKTVAIDRGHSVSDDFDAAVKFRMIKVQEVKGAEMGLKLLLAGRVDAYINDRIVGLYQAKQLAMTSAVKVSNKPLSQVNPAYLIFSKLSQNLDENAVTHINDALEAMWNDGTIEAIYASYPQRFE